MKTTSKEIRSHCAVNYGEEIFGDRWPLLIIRDIVFAGKKSYGKFLKSEQGIATNVLASRLVFLEEQEILSRAPSPDDRRKDFYTLTEKGLDLIPKDDYRWSWHPLPAYPLARTGCVAATDAPRLAG